MYFPLLGHLDLGLRQHIFLNLIFPCVSSCSTRCLSLSSKCKPRSRRLQTQEVPRTHMTKFRGVGMFPTSPSPSSLSRHVLLPAIASPTAPLHDIPRTYIRASDVLGSLQPVNARPASAHHSIFVLQSRLPRRIVRHRRQLWPLQLRRARDSSPL